MKANYEFKEEAYIDDIPFNTQRVVVESVFRNAFNVEFAFDDEDYIDDIPHQLLKMKMIVQSINLSIDESSIFIARLK